MLQFFIDNIFVMFGGHDFQQEPKEDSAFSYFNVMSRYMYIVIDIDDSLSPNNFVCGEHNYVDRLEIDSVRAG